MSQGKIPTNEAEIAKATQAQIKKNKVEKPSKELAFEEIDKAYSEFIALVKRHKFTLDPQIGTQFYGFKYRPSTQQELEQRNNEEKQMEIERVKAERKAKKLEQKKKLKNLVMAPINVANKLMKGNLKKK